MQNTACQWSGSTGTQATYVQVQVVNHTNCWSPPKLIEGNEKLSDIGKEVYITPEMGGSTAEAFLDDVIFAVAMNGGKASRASTVQLLRLLMERAK